MEREGPSYFVSIGEKRNMYRFMVGKRDGKRPLGRPKDRWEDTIKMNLEERGWECLVCFILAQERDKCPTVLNTY
jgi:hypothetical protein